MMLRLGLIALCLALPLVAQQVPDLAFEPPLGEARYAANEGPQVAIDAAHHNYHTADGRYQTFANLLRRDGFQVTSWKEPLTESGLGQVNVLVTSNALHESQSQEWAAPTASAFTASEIEVVGNWVRRGGSLMLIADHQPFPGAMGDLAKQFGIEFVDAYALDGPLGKQRGRLTYRRSDGNLLDHEVTTGVDSVANFGGSAFHVNGPHQPLMRLGPGAVARKADFRNRDLGYVGEPLSIGGWLQGATIETGKGRIAVFAEAAMFSAQLSGADQTPMGMNAPHAKDNPRLLVNVMRWLATR